MSDHRERRHILFVDDDPASRRVIERLLRAGVPAAKVTPVEDGSQALKVLEGMSTHLLITDLAMPGMDGIELLRQVANRRISVPVIVVTGRGGPTDETRSLSGGAIEFFEKPVQAEPFVRCVQGLLDTSEHRSRIEGVSIAGFVQLLNMERKTCALRVTTPETQGVLFFSSGVLVDARQDERVGVAAALEIFTWKDAVITLDALSRGRNTTIQASVTELLLESARLADERERNARRSGTQGGTSVRHEAVAAGASKGPGLSLVPAPGPVGPRRPARVVAEPEPAPASSLPLSASVSRALTAEPQPLVAAPASSWASVAAPAPAAPVRPQVDAAPSEPVRAPAPVTAASPPLAPWEQPAAQARISAALTQAMQLDGALGAALANWELDQCLAVQGGAEGLRIEVAVSGNCRVMRAMSACMARTGQKGGPQDIVIALDTQLHILTPLAAHDRLFLYVALDRSRGNLVLARHRLTKIVGELVF